MVEGKETPSIPDQVPFAWVAGVAGVAKRM